MVSRELYTQLSITAFSSRMLLRARDSSSSYTQYSEGEMGGKGDMVAGKGEEEMAKGERWTGVGMRRGRER